MAPALTSSWELESFVFSEGHGVKGLSEMKLERLPKQYFQPQEELHSASHVVEEVSIPVIDMSNCDDDPKVAELICDAAEKWGFFQIVNHGVPLRVLEDVKNATYKFFGQPAEEKRKYLKENTPDHNVRFGTSFTPHVEKALEWKDFLSCFYVSDEEVKAYWPSVCRDQLMEYMNESEPVIKKLLDVLMKGLNVQTLDETKQSILMGSRRINLNYYPKCPDHELTVGVGRHSDVSTLTVLLQDEIGGLYVRKMETDSWIHVVPIKGALIINIGDALQIMSNGRYKSIEHRVIANGENNRISVPIFVNPKPSDVIGPLPEVLEGGDQAFYKQVLYSDYCRYFYSKRHNGKDTLEFARI